MSSDPDLIFTICIITTVFIFCIILQWYIRRQRERRGRYVAVPDWNPAEEL